MTEKDWEVLTKLNYTVIPDPQEYRRRGIRLAYAKYNHVVYIKVDYVSLGYILISLSDFLPNIIAVISGMPHNEVPVYVYRANGIRKGNLIESNFCCVEDRIPYIEITNHDWTMWLFDTRLTVEYIHRILPKLRELLNEQR